MQIKTTMRYHLLPNPPEWLRSKRLIPPNADGDEKQLEFSYTAGGSIKWYNHFGKIAFISVLNIYLTYNPVIPRGMKTNARKKTCTKMFIAASCVSKN